MQVPLLLPKPEEEVSLILLVDDQSFNLFAFESMCKVEGVKTDAAPSGIDAL